MFKCKCNINKCTIFAGKLAVIVFVFIILNLWNNLAIWVQTTNVWWFIGIFVVLVLIIGGSCGSVKKFKITKKKKR